MRERRKNPIPNIALDQATLRGWIERRTGLLHRELPGIELLRWVNFHYAAIKLLLEDEATWVGFDGKILVVIRQLEWDSQVLDMPVWVLEAVLWSQQVGVRDVSSFLSGITSELVEDDAGILIHKCSPADTELLTVLRRGGFDLLTVHLDHLFDTEPRALEVPTGYEFGEARPDEAERIGDLSARNYSRLDRFHVDPLVPEDRVEGVYREWAENSVRGYADHVCVARHDGEVVAFGTWKLDEALARKTDFSCAWNGLACVDQSHQGRGVYRGVIASTMATFRARGVPHLASSTNALNTAAQRCFQAAGGHVYCPILTHRLAL